MVSRSLTLGSNLQRSPSPACNPDRLIGPVAPVMMETGKKAGPAYLLSFLIHSLKEEENDAIRCGYRHIQGQLRRGHRR